MVLGQMLLRTTTESGFNKSFREELDRERTSGTRGFDILSRNVRFQTFSASSNLAIIYLQNNKLSGYIPKALKSRGIIFNYAGNMDLKAGSQEKHHIIIIISALLGVSLLLAVSLCCYVLTRKTNKKNPPPEDDLTKAAPPAHKLHTSNAPLCEIATETCHPFRLCDLEEATKDFENRIGSGGFGIVYYGKLSDGREIAVKVPTNDSYQGKK
ncbi:hypothetical protein ZWY2020_028030 [Hordeum vulgare]|nr:hypothetical protein ZWY2020_028030 [Hordeum vulgare]